MDVHVDEDELLARQINQDFSQKPIEHRKALWLVLKSLVHDLAKQVMNAWLDDSLRQAHKEYYQLFNTTISALITDDIRLEMGAIFGAVNSVIQLSTHQLTYFTQIEDRIYYFFAENAEIHAYITGELNQDNSKLSQLLTHYNQFLVFEECNNLITVETYFDTLDRQVKKMLWQALRVPFDYENRESTDTWLAADAQAKSYAIAIKIDNELKKLLDTDVDFYIEAINDLLDMQGGSDPEKKIFIFFANHMKVFNYIKNELDKPKSKLRKVLKRYKTFLEGPFVSLHEEYAKKQKDEKKPPSGLKKLSLFQPPVLPANMVNVRALDFEKSLYHVTYRIDYRNKNPNALIHSNKQIIHHIAREIKKADFSDVIFMNGSLRQSFPADEFCCYLPSPDVQGAFIPSESSFTAIRTLQRQIMREAQVSCRTSKYLLADSFGNFEHGNVYREGIKKLKDPQYESDITKKLCVDDKSKFIILYALMHKVASENADKMIQFDFYSGNAFELRDLFMFFINNREFKPANLFLNMYLYDGNLLERKYQLDNYFPGPIDYDYEDNLKIIVDCCNGHPEEKPVSHLSAADEKKPELYLSVAANVVENRPNTPVSATSLSIPCTVSLNVLEKFLPKEFLKKRVTTKTLAASEKKPSMSLSSSSSG